MRVMRDHVLALTAERIGLTSRPVAVALAQRIVLRLPGRKEGNRREVAANMIAIEAAEARETAAKGGKDREAFEEEDAREHKARLAGFGHDRKSPAREIPALCPVFEFRALEHAAQKCVRFFAERML